MDLPPAPEDLDFAACERARYARDPAWDGVIFIGVRSTGIYCRPVCPARQPLSRNVRYYRSAAAAEAAGHRPCLRCRPETAPFSPAWNGTRSTVGRALRLIEAGALDTGTVAALAERLGLGPRHLTRLFERHLGASPAAVARTRRVQRAKRLIDTTHLTMTEIAAQAGFASLRSFNAAFRAAYRCAPTDLRRKERGGLCPPRPPPTRGQATPGPA
ncbi:bifunctional transcriptional activator/DNA repair enzyme AdaA [Paracraurococcus ruber]|uniref:Transcriptional regulator n=1 Tax=Paracraurococcus ruber TaxID=77675 RepID=A0ABS1D1I4_9PROT|nr:Ada metal-binding domain-containing protein [Paracraurococcus ruber]MBK1660690.1 transcriptional regulator [Paracraurococcus ruber]TDG31601.1 methylphosphotriester-DNA--protein-cysteine methyltransferase family protein [Paracraurococcus ruber]